MAVPAATARRLTPPGDLRDAVLWAAAAAYAVIYFVLGYIKYAGHRNFVDLGIFTQTAVSAFGCFCNPIEGSHWAFHFSPILYVVGIVVHVWHSALALTAIQAMAGALTAPPIYGVVRRYADRKTALLTACVVLLYPPLAGVIFNDFHENGLAPAAVAWLLWAFDGGFLLATLVFAAIALAIKEDQALFLAAAGAIGAFAYRRDVTRMRLATVVAVASVAVFVLYFTVIQPHAGANGHWAPLRFYGWWWPVAGLPALVMRAILERAGYLVLAFLPLLFIPFRNRAVVLAVLPLLEVLASSMPTTFTMGSHYAGVWIGYVFFAFALGIVSIARLDARSAHRMLCWCIALCAIEFAVADPLHPGYFLHAPSARDARLDAYLRTLPPDVAVATQEEAYTHLAAIDPSATLLPESATRPLRSCYVLTDRDFPESVRLIEMRAYMPQFARAFAVVQSDGAITLYASRACRSEYPPPPSLR